MRLTSRSSSHGVSTTVCRRAFAAMDRLLDELHAFLVMPNHVRLLATPALALPKLTKSLKGITARRANAMLALTASPFWQEESYDPPRAASAGVREDPELH